MAGYLELKTPRAIMAFLAVILLISVFLTMTLVSALTWSFSWYRFEVIEDVRRLVGESCGTPQELTVMQTAAVDFNEEIRVHQRLRSIPLLGRVLAPPGWDTIPYIPEPVDVCGAK